MKKVLYSKIAKLVYLVILLALISLSMVDVFELVNRQDDRDSAYFDLKNYYYDNEYDNMIYEGLGTHVNRIIELYKVNGMDGVEEYCNTYCSPCNYIFNIVIATKEELFVNSPDGIEHDYSAITDRIGFVENFGRWGDYYYETPLTMYVNNELQIKKQIGSEYVYAQAEMDEYLGAAAVSFLKDGGLYLKINASYDLCDEISYKIESLAESQITMTYGSLKDWILENIGRYIGYGIGILLSVIILVVTCGRESTGKKPLNRYESTSTELHIIMTGVAVVLGICAVAVFCEAYNHYSDEYVKYAETLLIGALVVCVAMFCYQAGILIKKIINKRFFRDFFIVNICKKIKNKIIKLKKAIYTKSGYEALPEIKKLYTKKVMMDIIIAIAFLGILIAGCAFIDEFLYWDSFRLLLIFFVLMVVFAIFYITLSYKEYRQLQVYNKICKSIDLVYNGYYGKLDIAENENHKVLNQVANLSENFKKSVAKQIEAEKMQIELVANVSHDLKTPLTSIISYVDLLSKEELPPVAQDYVRVLEEKSARLKDIVADVFDLAKATSGEQVPMEQLDGVVLINQVLSDMSDRIEESGKDLRVKISADTAPVTGNGQKLYRVFQNVIDNALKYSMPGTRIYLSAEQTAGEFKVTVKNISEYEIDYTEQEILSRFTRGDKSRHSEGNGLGLSIAKSFTELCGGTFEVKLDDDLFKVIIVLR